MAELHSIKIRKELLSYLDFFKNMLEEHDILYDDGLDMESALAEIQDIHQNIDQTRAFTIAFVGEYNSGKTTLINLLSGSTLPTDTDVATQQVERIEWKGMTLIDTPGLGSGLAEHDAITQEWLAKADLLVYVLTPDLFTGASGQRFLSMLDQYKRDHELMLVVNQIDREASDIATYREQLQAFIDPRHLDWYYPVFVSAEYYKFSQNAEYDTDDRAYFEQKSEFASLLRTLDTFLLDKREKALLTTPLTQLCLLTRKFRLRSQFDKEEMLLDQKVSVCDQALRDFKIAESDHRDRVADLIRGTCGTLSGVLECPPDTLQNVVKQEFSEFVEQVEASMNVLLTTLDAVAEDFYAANAKIEQSELFRLVESRIDHSKVLQNIFRSKLFQAQTGDSKASTLKDILNDKFKRFSHLSGISDVQSVLDSPNFLSAIGKLAGKIDKKTVLKVGKALKYKFKPWQAGKIAKRISQSVPYLNAAAVAWDVGEVVVDNVKAAHAAKRLREAKEEIKKLLEEIRNEHLKILQEDAIQPLTEIIRVVREQCLEKKVVLARYSAENEIVLTKFKEHQQQCFDLYDQIYNTTE